MNYYNEFDPKAAQWLRNLIAESLIPHGEVDDRSITEVTAKDLAGFTQCHFFAGIGGWSLALQLANWPTTRPVWTGSCPCQPFSTAGNRKGKSDERHLWPVWFELIRQCRPPTIFGEQVSSAIAHGWLDDVYKGLEAEGYACGSAVLPACSVGAPHKRDRLWFVADLPSERLQDGRKSSVFRPTPEPEFERCGSDGIMGHPQHNGQSTPALDGSDGAPVFNDTQGQDSTSEFAGTSGASHVANAIDPRPQGHRRLEQEPVSQGWQGAQRHPWQTGVWIDCPDGKQRLIEPSIPLLANGIPARVVKLRALGNAIVPQVAAQFINAYMEI